MKNKLLLIAILIFSSSEIFSQSLSTNIKLNQVGYFTNGEKIAIVKTSSSGTFSIKSTDLATTFYNGSYSAPAIWSPSNENVAILDFTSFNANGIYIIVIPGIGKSYDFKIDGDIAADVFKASLKMYYFMRCSSPVLSTHGGIWARGAGHPDTQVKVHASAATNARPTGTLISGSKGWYDAGDYNKYIVNSGISTYTLLAAYEHYPALYNSLNTNIPESGNSIPDILDEAKYNLDWMLTMQDPNDGGVYHKLTHPGFDGIIMPANSNSTDRWVVKKSTSASLNFAAVMAQASRVYSTYLPTFSSTCLAAAQSAYNWAIANPTVYYDQTALNNSFNPDISTGTYSDNTVTDEFQWAAAELYITTLQDSYHNAVNWNNVGNGVPSWSNTSMLGIYSLVFHRQNLTAIGYADTTIMKNKLISAANTLKNTYNSSAYKVTMSGFTWGSNGDCGNQGMLLLQAFKISNDNTYRNAAIACFDYIMGRNAPGYSFLTGYGSKTPLSPHHRPSAADGVTAPVPGMVVGGPTSSSGDNCTYQYPTSLPALHYIDDWCSYTSNEITINWNAPLVFLLGGLKDMYSINSNLQVTAACSDNITFNWDGSGNNWFIDVSTDPNFSFYYNKSIANQTSTTAPSGFICDTVYGTPCTPTALSFQLNTTYYWRIWNGSGHLIGNSFTVPTALATPTITQNGNVLTSSAATNNQWYLNTNSITGATLQNYSPTQGGNYTLTVTDTNGCSATSAVFNYTTTAVTPLSSEEEQGLKLYPNPNNGSFILQTSTHYTSLKITILNLLGEQIYFDQITTNPGERVIKLHEGETGNVSNGIYFMQVLTGGIIYNQKIIIQ